MFYKQNMYDYDVDCDLHCHCCEESQKKLDDSVEFLEEVVKQLYINENLDKEVLHHCIEELCFYLKVKLPKCELQIERPRQTLPTWLNEWKDFNQSYLTKLA